MAQEYKKGDYIPLEKNFIESLGLTVPEFSTSNSKAADLLTTTSFLYTAGIMIAVLAAGIMYMRAGAIRMQNSHTAVSKSNEEIRRVTLGLLGILSLFVIIYTFNRDLLYGTVGLDKLRASSTPPITSPSTGTTGTAPSTPTTPTIPRNNDDPTGWAAIQNDAAVRAQLKALPNGGITVNRSVCTVPTQHGCTTVGGLPPQTLSMLAELRATCSGQIEITGGTEAGHSSHGPGKSPVDLSINKPGGLNDCIRGFQKVVPPPKNRSGGDWCKAAYTKFNYTFCDEISAQPHWHVYKPGS